MLAVILESGEPTRLYTALSLLVSSDDARGLISFGALPALIEADFEPHLAALWGTARPAVTLHACAAAVDEHGSAGPFEVISMPRFLSETKESRLVVV